MYLLQQEAVSEGPEKTYLQLTPTPDSAEWGSVLNGCEGTETSCEDWLRWFLLVRLLFLALNV